MQTNLDITPERLLEDFELYLEVERNLSPHTIKAYHSDLRDFIASMGNDFCSFSYKNIRAYLVEMQGRKYSRTTISRKIAAIKTFYRYLYRERLVKINPAVNIKTPKKIQTLPEFLTDTEINLTMEQVEPLSPSSYRDRTILEVLYATGMRNSELCGLNLENINFSDEIAPLFDLDFKFKSHESHHELPTEISIGNWISKNGESYFAGPTTVGIPYETEEPDYSTFGLMNFANSAQSIPAEKHEPLSPTKKGLI